jgi:hypothetical protein
MTIKYKLGFTIDSETLFGILSKFLPIQDLSVEEVVDHPAPERVLKRADLPALLHSLHKPKHRDAPRRRNSRPVNLSEGINGIIMEAMADGKPHAAVEFRPLLRARTYSENSVTSRLEELKKHGYVKHLSDGKWELTPKSKEAIERPFPALKVEDRT